MKKISLIICFLVSISNYAQLGIDEVMGVPTGVTSDTSLAPDEPGAIFYNTETKELLIFNGDSWVNTSSSSPTVYTGYFIIEGPGGSTKATKTFIKSIDEVPFKPSQVTFTAYANIESETINDDNGESSPSGGNNNTGMSNAFGTMQGFVRENDDDSIDQQVIYVGGSGNSINDISRFSSPSHCIGLRYSNQNGNNFGIINGSYLEFNDDGFDITINYIVGSESNSTVERSDFKDEDVLVMFTAYK